MASHIERRKFLATLGAVAAWPLATRAQQPAMPVIGLLDPRSPDAMADRLRAFRLGLKDVGYVEGDNVTIIYRFAEDQNDRLPEVGGRTGSPAGHRNRRERNHRGARCQGGNHDDPDRLYCRPRPGQARSCCQPRPAGRQPDGDQLFQR